MTTGSGDLVPAQSPGQVSERVCTIVTAPRAPRSWRYALLLCLSLALLFPVGISWLFYSGVGIFGLNIPVAWALDIISVVWWIGIAHAGTLISAALLLTRQPWRASINRAAEAMALFAILLAGTYTLLHLGRPQFFYYLLPYPDTMALWPQWRSPLVWDFFAIATYLLYTTCFFYLSLLPDLATLRDRVQGRARRLFYGVLALGWRNSARHWQRYEQANGVLAVIAAPIVVGVTGTISLDFAVGIVPGFHFTIFPPYFVAGALYSGFATVVIIAIALRAFFGLHDLITREHLNYLGMMMLAFVLFVQYAYIMEPFTAFYSGDEHYRTVYINRWTGPYAPVYWSMLVCNALLPQLLWSGRVRRNVGAMLALAIVADVGMWLERFVIVVTSTQRDFLHSAWGTVMPRVGDWVVFAGSIGVFLTLLLLFARLLPPVSIHDMRAVLQSRRQHNEEVPSERTS